MQGKTVHVQSAGVPGGRGAPQAKSQHCMGEKISGQSENSGILVRQETVQTRNAGGLGDRIPGHWFSVAKKGGM